MKYLVMLVCLFVLLPVCAYSASQEDQPLEPTAVVTSFKALPTKKITPCFEIVINIVNPKATPLQLAGLTYTIELEGSRTLNGKTKEIPDVQPNSEEQVLLTVSPDDFDCISRCVMMMQQPCKVFKYDMQVNLDIVGEQPEILLSSAGDIELLMPIN